MKTRPRREQKLSNGLEGDSQLANFSFCLCTTGWQIPWFLRATSPTTVSRSRKFDTSAKRAMTLPGQLDWSCRLYLCSREVGRPLTASELLFERLGAEYEFWNDEFWNDGFWNDALRSSPRRCRRIYELGTASRIERSPRHDSFVPRVQSA